MSKKDDYDEPKPTASSFRHYLESDRYVDRVLKFLLSRKNSREEPNDLPRIREILRDEFLSGYSPFFVGLWGGYKESSDGKADLADKRALDNLARIRGGIIEIIPVKLLPQTGAHVYPQNYYPELCLLFCDVHHAIANRRGWDEISAYRDSLEPLVKKHGFGFHALSDNEFFQIEQCREIYFPFQALSHPHTIYSIDSNIKAREIMQDGEFSEEAAKAAQKHSLWLGKDYGFRIAPEDIAKLYAEMEIHFLDIVHRKYHAGIFFSYSDPRIQRPIAQAANVPMLFLNPYGEEGVHECPWYSEMKE